MIMLFKRIETCCTYVISYENPNFSYRIKYSLNRAMRKQQLPINLTTLGSKNKELHELLDQKKGEQKAIGP
jgi:hypothetical protein